MLTRRQAFVMPYNTIKSVSHYYACFRLEQNKATQIRKNSGHLRILVQGVERKQRMSKRNQSTDEEEESVPVFRGTVV